MIKDDLIDKYIKNNFFGKLIGMHFDPGSFREQDGILEYYLTIGKEHLATPLAAHGGVICSLIDAAMGVAALRAVSMENKAVSTVEYKLNFLAPAAINDSLVAKAKVEQKGRRILIVSCDVFCVNKENKLIAKALGTFNSYEAGQAGY